MFIWHGVVGPTSILLGVYKERCLMPQQYVTYMRDLGRGLTCIWLDLQCACLFALFLSVCVLCVLCVGNYNKFLGKKTCL